MKQLLIKLWRFLLLKGIIEIIFGIIFIVWPEKIISSIMILVGIFLLFEGLLSFFGVMSEIGKASLWKFIVLESVITIFSGIIIIDHPLITSKIVYTVLIFWMLSGVFFGILKKIARFSLNYNKSIFMFNIFVIMLFGGWLLFKSFAFEVVFWRLIGFFTFSQGVSNIMRGLRMKKEKNLFFQKVNLNKKSY